MCNDASELLAGGRFDPLVVNERRSSLCVKIDTYRWIASVLENQLPWTASITSERPPFSGGSPGGASGGRQGVSAASSEGQDKPTRDTALSGGMGGVRGVFTPRRFKKAPGRSSLDVKIYIVGWITSVTSERPPFSGGLPGGASGDRPPSTSHTSRIGINR